MAYLSPMSVLLTLTLLSGALLAGEGPTRVTVDPSQKWWGISKDAGALEAAPESPFVSDLATWSSLWSAWRAEEPLPEVDFVESIVLVRTVDGPNRARMQVFSDPQGNLTTRVLGTRKGGPGFGYVFWVIDRKRVRSVDGEEL